MNIGSSYIVALMVPIAVCMAFAPEIFLHVVIANVFCLTLMLALGKPLGIDSIQSPIAPVFLTLLSSMSIISYSASVTLGTPVSPYIPGGDAEGYYTDAQLMSGDIESYFSSISTNYRGYQVLLALLFQIFGSNLFVGMCFNYFLIFLSALLIAGFATEATQDRVVGKYTLLACAISPHFLALGTILQKDAVLIFGFSLFLYSSIRVFHAGKRNLLLVTTLVMAFALIGVSRLPFLVFPVSLLFLFQAFGMQQGKLGSKVERLVLVLIVIGIFVAMLPLMTRFTVYDFDAEMIESRALDDSRMAEHIADTSQSGFVNRISGIYTGQHPAVRALLLPLPMLVQYLLPFQFLNPSFLSDHPWYFVTNQMQLLWLVLLGPSCVYITINFLRIKNTWIRVSLLIGVLMYAGVAFTSLGVIPRYATPSLVMVFPAVGYLWANRLRDPQLKQRFSTWLQRYWILGLLLFVAYYARQLS